jgi:HAD superfamily hydrolase (TIGR01549 family)
MVKAVVFDAGETLVNESRQWRMWAEWLKVPDHVLFAALGAIIERGEHHQRVFQLLKPGFDLDAAREERRKSGAPDRFDRSDFYGDVFDCFNELRKCGLRLGIAGNQPEDFLQAVSDGDLPVDFIASSAQWRVEKPSPAFFSKLVDELNLPPSSIAYVGDRLDNDVLPALAAGLIAVFIRRGPWGFLHAQRPEATNAHLRIDSLSELPSAFESLTG